MEAVNCLRCEYKDADNGNCTAAGGFCTAVQAAHCPLLRQYLGTRMTPEQVKNAKTIIEHLESRTNQKTAGSRQGRARGGAAVQGGPAGVRLVGHG